MAGVDPASLAHELVDRLDGRRVATAESCTAGRIATLLACVEHAADFLLGGLVAYGEDVKRDQLGVIADSVLSAQAAQEMAAGVASMLGAEVSVSTTGVAGDDTCEGTPPGTVYIATFVDGRTDVREHHFAGSPEEVCDHARDQALRDLIDALHR